MRLFIAKLIVSGVIFAGVVSPASTKPLGSRSGATTSLVAQNDPPISRAKQEVDRLMAMTKPGYYTALFITNRQARLMPNARRAADPCNSALCSANPMPVRLIKFSGERLDETQVKLTWETSEEVNNDYFGIQRSVNPALGFETIASVKGAGSSSRPITYQTIDPNTNTEYTYYRLKQVDLDGTFTYSSIIAIKGGLPILAVKPFPNPSQQKTIGFQVAGLQAAEQLSVLLYDAQGRVVYQHENCVLDSKQQIVMPTLSGLQPGHYYVRIKTKNQQASTSFILLQ